MVAFEKINMFTTTFRFLVLWFKSFRSWKCMSFLSYRLDTCHPFFVTLPRNYFVATW